MFRASITTGAESGGWLNSVHKDLRKLRAADMFGLEVQSLGSGSKQILDYENAPKDNDHTLKDEPFLPGLM